MSRVTKVVIRDMAQVALECAKTDYLSAMKRRKIISKKTCVNE